MVDVFRSVASMVAPPSPNICRKPFIASMLLIGTVIPLARAIVGAAGAVVSTVIVAVARAALGLPATSVKAPALMLIVATPSKPAVGVKVNW